MAKVKFKQIEIISLIRDSEKLLSLLQRRGIVQIEETCLEGASKLNMDKNISFLKERLSVSNRALEILNRCGGQKGGFLKSLEGRKEMSGGDLKSYAKQIKKIYGDCLFIVSKRKETDSLKSQIAGAKTALKSVLEWESLNIPTSYTGTVNTSTFIGFFKKSLSDADILDLLKERKVDVSLCFVDIVDRAKEQTKFVLTCHKSIEKEVSAALFNSGFSYPANPTKHPPIVRITRLNKEIQKAENELKEAEAVLNSKLGLIEQIEILIDYLRIDLQKYEGFSKLAATDKTTVLKGYVPASKAQKLKEETESKFMCFADIKDIEDFSPSALKNGKFSKPVEPITEMYALPGKQDIDPTPVMAFFYYLFFGMMLSDAGYGVVMVVVTSILLRKKRPEGNLRKTLKMFFYCGISTIFWGALFGGWFGDIAKVVGREFFGVSVPSLAIWYEPLNDPMSLLLLSFLLGIFHLFLGYIVRFNMVRKEEGIIAAAVEVFPTMLLITGAAPLAAGILTYIPPIFTTIGSYMAIVAIILIVLTNSGSKNLLKRLGGGIYGLYNIASGSLSDVLSYSRLLALGLATGSIANVVNLMGTMPSNIYVKGVMLVVVFFVGHTLNLAINMLGSYVHSNRLQFVELFSKFYEGGGEKFTPLKADTKYIRLKD